MSSASDAVDACRPSWPKFLREGPALVRLLLSQFRKPQLKTPVGNGRPVMVIPGFLANDMTTALLRRTLDACGYRAFGWNDGMNLGARADSLERLGARLDEIIAEAGRPVAVVGWSLGGLYARELAKVRAADIDLVITLGTPFSVHLRANNAWKLYELINDHKVDNPPVPIGPHEKPPVRTIAVWSRRDGIVATASARGAEGEADERVELHCTHMEFVSDPEALEAVVALLRR